ncbi:hypothetical protein NKG94_30465 [Micromonospora sp. M12]
MTDYSYDTNGRLTTVTSDRGTTAVRTARVLYGSTGNVSTVEQTGTAGSTAASSTATTAVAT